MSANSSELASRLDAIGSAIAKQTRGANLSAFVTLVIGAAVLGGLTFWFNFGLNMAKEVTEVRFVADLAEAQVTEQVPAGRKQLEEYVSSNAAGWAKTASQTMIDNIPGACDWAADTTLERIDDQLREGQVTARTHLRAYLVANKAKLKEGLDRLSANPASSEQFIAELMATFEKEQNVEVMGMVRETINYLRTLNAQLAKLKLGKGLTERERLLRELLMIFRRMAVEAEKEGAKPSAPA